MGDAARRDINAALNAAAFGGGITSGSGRTIAFFITRRSFGFNFYEVLGSDGSVAPDGTLIWQKYYSGTANDYVKQVTGTATHEFGLVPTRFIRVLWKSWDASNRWAFRGFAEELQVFGEGFPQNLEFLRLLGSGVPIALATALRPATDADGHRRSSGGAATRRAQHCIQ